jgi:hypothetical protein
MHALANKIRDYCQSQKELWNKIPWLALQANGRGGYCDEYSRNYRLGIIALGSGSSGGCYNYFIDLATGGLVGRNGLGTMPLGDLDVISIDPRELNAEAHIERLEKACQKPDGGVGISVPDEGFELWRTSLAQQFGILPDEYIRRKPIRFSFSIF